jgi:hypothetical protein
MFVWANCPLNEFSEILQTNPFWLVSATATKWAWDVASVFVTLAVFHITRGQIGFTIAMRIGCQDLYFEHVYLLSVGTKKPTPNSRN